MAGKEQEAAVRLTYHLHFSQPVELKDLTEAMNGLADEYRRFAGSLEIDGTKLYVREMKQGSLLIELVAFATQWAESANTLIQFAQYLRGFFKAKEPDKDESANARSLQNVANIVEPVANDPGAQLTINVSGNTAPVTIVQNFTSNDANAFQNRVAKQIKQLKEPEAGFREKVLMYWHQARNDATNVGDKAIIESLSEKPVRTIFANDHDKAVALHGHGNPFHNEYIVDVQVETRGNKPALYKIMHLHDVVRHDEPAALPPPQTPAQ